MEIWFHGLVNEGRILFPKICHAITEQLLHYLGLINNLVNELVIKLLAFSPCHQGLLHMLRHYQHQSFSEFFGFHLDLFSWFFYEFHKILFVRKENVSVIVLKVTYLQKTEFQTIFLNNFGAWGWYSHTWRYYKAS